MKLTDIPVLADLPQGTIQWLEDRCETRKFNDGDYVFQPGEPADHLLILMEGKIEISRVNSGGKIPVTVMEAGEVSGRLPYSRMKQAGAYGQATGSTVLLGLHKRHFPDLGYESTELMQRLVGLMSDRVRSFTRIQQQEEKMAALGKLSAGLAHEINNPASAIDRTSTTIRNEVRLLPNLVSQLLEFNIEPSVFQEVNALIFSSCSFGYQEASMMEMSDLEDELIDWLEEREVESAYELAEVFVKTGIRTEGLEQIENIIPADALEPTLLWVQKILETEKLAVEVHDASKRISELVTAIKTYSHMDRAPDFEMTNIVEGIDSTLTMLGHKLRDKKISIQKNLADNLPRINARPGELNQVWTNIIDNAIDALDGQEGQLKIETYYRNDSVKVNIEDNGPGIPEDILSKIFDPFFTTKGVGKGTGLGLDIVQRIIKTHNGSITVRSVPGSTCFEICFPVN